MTFVKELESIRGILAIWVMLSHWTIAVSGAVQETLPALQGNYAVQIFMIMSGFVICMLRDNDCEPYATFLVRRCLRLFPTYLVVLIFMAVLLGYAEAVLVQSPQSQHSTEQLSLARYAMRNFWPDLAVHAALLQGLVPPSIAPNSLVTFVSQAWSITVEWQFYLIAPLLIGWVLTLPRLSSLVGIVAVVTVLLLVSPWIGIGFVAHYLDLFGLGIASYLAWRAVAQRRLIENLNYLRALTVLALVACGLVFRSPIPALIWIGTLYGILASRFEEATIERKCCWLLRTSPICYLGQISYSIYLVHVVVLLVCLDVLNRFALGDFSRAYLLLTMLVCGTIAVSTVLHACVEKPCIKFGRKFMLGLRTIDRNAAAPRAIGTE